jgi:hypothetical protein
MDPIFVLSLFKQSFGDNNTNNNNFIKSESVEELVKKYFKLF